MSTDDLQGQALRAAAELLAKHSIVGANDQEHTHIYAALTRAWLEGYAAGHQAATEFAIATVKP